MSYGGRPVDDFLVYLVLSIAAADILRRKKFLFFEKIITHMYSRDGVAAVNSFCIQAQ